MVPADCGVAPPLRHPHGDIFLALVQNSAGGLPSGLVPIVPSSHALPERTRSAICPFRVEP
jgi:hypothetical protein